MAGVSSALLSVYQFHVFTESRWSTVGAASRNILCSSVLGYKHFLHHMRRQGCVSEYYVSGADRCDSLLSAFRRETRKAAQRYLHRNGHRV
eukprot:540220-Amphidinium_carterae.1